ncbi:MAG: hypothetical protein AAF629_26530 [Chloroflexota bacterium]
MTKSFTTPLYFILIVLLVACGELSSSSTTSIEQKDGRAASVTEQVQLPDTRTDLVMAYTHHRLDGNRVVAGHGDLPNLTPIDIALSVTPQWIVAVPAPSGSRWVVIGNDGAVEAFLISDGAVIFDTVIPEQLPTGMPPILIDSQRPSLLLPPSAEASQATHPVLLPNSGRLAFIERNGDLIVRDDRDDTEVRLPVNALLDGRLLVDDQDRILLLTDPTPEYAHGVLGDKLEAGGMTLVETQPQVRIAMQAWLPKGTVIEGISPLWADMTGDDRRDIVVTLSNEQQGAWIAVFNEAGKQIATGPAIGQAYRWRHQLAIAPFSQNGQPMLVDVLTPHLGGIVEFYQLMDDQLTIVGRQPGYTSHVIGSRNLDMALAGDFDGDNHIELLLPNQARTELGAIAYDEQGTEVVYALPVAGKVMTNLAAVTLADGSIAVGVGHQDQVLRIWHP